MAGIKWNLYSLNIEPSLALRLNYDAQGHDFTPSSGMKDQREKSINEREIPPEI